MVSTLKRILFILYQTFPLAFGVALLAVVYSAYLDHYFQYGMYGLIAEKGIVFFPRLLLGLFVLGLIMAVECFIIMVLSNKKECLSKHVLSVICATIITLLYSMVAGYYINNYWLPSFKSLQSIIGNSIFVITVPMVWFSLYAVGREDRIAFCSKIFFKKISLVTIVIVCLWEVAFYSWHNFIGKAGENVVFIGVDTLRADHMSCYGYERNTTPNIDTWAKGATIFNQCITATPRTTQSLATILTSRYPHNTTVRNLNDFLPRAELSLAEILKNDGYATVAVIATGIPYKKIIQGFDVVIDTEKEWDATETVNRTLEALTQIKGKYFLFVFFRDPHMPYNPPRVIFNGDYKGRFKEQLYYFPSKAKNVFQNNFSDKLRRHAVDLYDSEVNYTDEQFERLISAIKKKNDQNIILFFSDHGESLGEHDFYYDHGDLLYQPSLRIPFIIEGIPFDKPRIVDVVRSIDFVPTILGHLDISVKNHVFEGVDLRLHRKNLMAFSETGRALLDTAYQTKKRFLKGLRGRLRSIVMNNKKIIYLPKPGSVDYEIYDLSVDPEELENMDEKGGDAFMKAELLKWIESDKTHGNVKEKILDEETTQRLKSLGYL